MSKGKAPASQALKLTYFDARGRCETIRYLLALGKIKYEDERISQEAWKDKKSKTLFGGLPVTKTSEGEIYQSMAEARYVAKLAKLYGDPTNFYQQAVIDMIADTVNDFREHVFTAIAFEQDQDNRKKKVEEFLSSSQVKLDGLAKLLGDKDYFVGKVSLADIHFYACMEVAFTTGNVSNFLDKQPKLKKLYERVGKIKEIESYVKSRNATPF